MSQAGAQLMTRFGIACELRRDWRSGIEGLGAWFSKYIPDYRNLVTSSTHWPENKKAGSGKLLTIEPQKAHS